MKPQWMHNSALQGAGTAAVKAGVSSRRGFLKAGAAATGGLVLGFMLPSGGRMAHAAEAKPQGYAPNAFLRVAPDNTVTVIVNRLEFGQGVHTALPMVIADELDADWAQIRAELAPAGDAYKDPAFGMQITGGSGTIAHSFTQYREIGARARAMLVSAAAQQWNVRPDACRTAKGMVYGPAGQKASYGALADAAMKLPAPEQVALKDPKQFKFIGKPTRRLDARAKSSGHQQFGIDFKPPGAKLMVAVVAHAPVFGAKVAKVDASKAKAVRGVIDVLEIPLDRGGRGVAVIADGYWPARQARDLLAIEWHTEGLGKTSSETQLIEFTELSKKPGAIAKTAETPSRGSAARTISAVYEFPYLAHAPMEPINCTVDLKDDSCTLWVGTQFQTGDRAAAAATAGLAPEQVTLHTLMAGGGFGRRGVPSSDFVVEAVNIAKACKAAGHAGPVKMIWSREDDIKGGYYRPSHVHRADIALDARGNIVAWDHVVVGQSIAQGTSFEGFMIQKGVDSTMVEGLGEPYDVPMNLSAHMAQANVPVLWWRSVGSTHTAFVMETLIDEAAHAAGMDPVAYRKKLIDPARHPRQIAALDLAVAKSGYGKKTLPKGHAWGVAVHESFNTVVAYVVEASIQDGTPKLHKATAGVHCNLAVNPLTVEAQIQGAALMGLGLTLPGARITLKDGVVEQQNFSDYQVARMLDMPQIEVHIVPSTEAPTGLGEPGLPPLAPAFANALFKLNGKRQRKLPFETAAA
ncbi:xanthine dehydrogenase family protein molybdopterin-binding subunit [Massilia sp. 9096]|uniref:xanthine dehydrogenase family protein molybdopterin-binding subunit n=1 Tax=Massilia sp. 9096 TaxID=1500894 RepID=UPI000562CE19|nr:xanthine dehydrogenase family protein molybdopterin-binding subunit [Massilia sp. 9096]